MSDLQHRYARPLNDIELTTSFVVQVLQSKPGKQLLKDIVTGEASLLNYDTTSPTLSSKKHRIDFRDNEDRWKLRKRIVTELYSNKRLPSDDKIKLGAKGGGALPNSELQHDHKAIIITGLPASGKSGISNFIADNYGAIILDSDYAKRKLPEYRGNPAGATLVHEESDIVVNGYIGRDKPDDFKSLFELCSERETNIVIPKIGHDASSLEKYARGLKGLGYKVHLILVSLDRKKATARALQRFKESKRYVPLSLIFDGYGNEPILAYYRLKEWNTNTSLFESIGKLSTDVERGKNPLLISYTHLESPACLYR